MLGDVRRRWYLSPSPVPQLTLGWQYPYSVQHSAYCGHPPTWSMSSALLGKAGQLPWPEPGDTRPCDEANSCTCTCSEEAGPRGGS